MPQGKATKKNGLGQLDKQGINEQLVRARTTEARRLLLYGLSRIEVAEKMGVTYQTVVKYCKGIQNNGNALFTGPGIKISAVVDSTVFGELDSLVSTDRTMSQVIRDAIDFALEEGFK